MSNFMDGIKSTLNNECNVSVTENGAVGFRTTGKALLDLNFAVASLRSASEHDISQRFTKAFFEDKKSSFMTTPKMRQRANPFLFWQSGCPAARLLPSKLGIMPRFCGRLSA